MLLGADCSALRAQNGYHGELVIKSGEQIVMLLTMISVEPVNTGGGRWATG
jgi:hypothetical protein